MNKSTPLNQLPHPASAVSAATGNMSAGGFVSEQQRQMISQAQQAAQNFALPQNTQPSNDVLNTDDDATVQEVLNQLNQASAIMQQQSTGMQPPPPNNNPSPVNAMHLSSGMEMMQGGTEHAGGQNPNAPAYHPSLFEPSPASMAMKAGVAMMPAAYSFGNMGTVNGATGATGATGGMLGSYGAMLYDPDLKLLCLAAAAYIIVTMIPVERFVYQYVSLYKIPYSDLFVKAFLCGVIVYLFSKFT